MYSLNNVTLYEYIDKLKETTDITNEAAAATEQLVQAMLAEVDATKAASLLNNPKQIEAYVNAVQGVQSVFKNSKGEKTFGNAAEILNSESYSIRERTEAFEALRDAILDLGDPEITKAFNTAYSE